MTSAAFASFKLRSTVGAVSLLVVAFTGAGLCLAQQVPRKELPVVWVLSTGGTIAGRGPSTTSLTNYKPGSLLGECYAAD